MRLLTGRPGGIRFAVPLLVFAPLLSVGVLSISVFAAIDDQPLEIVQLGIFVVITLIGAALAWLTLDPGRQSVASPATASEGGS